MKHLLSITFILFLSACSGLQKQTDWPDNIPSRSYFIDYYHQDHDHRKVLSQDDYLKWIHRFYFGWSLYGRGWLQATEELAETIDDPQQKMEAKKKSLLIGKLISPEWAKNRNHRVINTQHIIMWGNTINESVARGEQLPMLDKILDDVAGLLARSIDPNEISQNRYYPLDNFGDDFE